MKSSDCGDDYNPIEMAGFINGQSASFKGAFESGVSQLSITYTCEGGSLDTQVLENPSNVVLIAGCTDVSEVTVNASTESGTCTYVVIVPCLESEMCSGTRRLHDESFNDHSMSGESLEFATTEQPGDDAEDIPYCLSEDFPCGREEENMVHVCHYSPRKGYQTFCVPERDSDLLRYYPDDYCGPCVDPFDSS